VPPMSDFTPSCASTERWLGASTPMPPI
jgi:hypothetical protein